MLTRVSRRSQQLPKVRRRRITSLFFTLFSLSQWFCVVAFNVASVLEELQAIKLRISALETKLQEYE